MIKIICGVYGHKVGGRVVPMTKNSEPFELTPEQEARLVARGVAAYVDEPPTPENGGGQLPDGVGGVPEYSAETSAKELREIGKSLGLTFKVGMSKAEMVAALDKHTEENSVDGYDLEDTDADEGEDTDEDAPDFNAADALVE